MPRGRGESSRVVDHETASKSRGRSVAAGELEALEWGVREAFFGLYELLCRGPDCLEGGPLVGACIQSGPPVEKCPVQHPEAPRRRIVAGEIPIARKVRHRGPQVLYRLVHHVKFTLPR